MQSDLDRYGVDIVALSKDTAEEAEIHKTRDGLSMTLLADPNLDVIKQYGVEHHKGFGATTGKITVGGIPLAFKPSFKTMAIPTSLLVDESGVIKWIDQADDYRLRSDNDRVLQAVRDAFG